MPSTIPTAMFEAHIEPLKGHVKDGDQVDFQAPLAAAVTFSPGAGRLCSLNSSGEFEMGLTDKWAMPMYLMGNGANGYDVAVPTVTVGGAFLTQPVIPNSTKTLTALVAGACVEIATAAYDTGKTYGRNDFLTSKLLNSTRNTDATNGGLIWNRNVADNAAAIPYTDPIVGQVSRGLMPVDLNGNITRLAFWTRAIPVGAR